MNLKKAAAFAAAIAASVAATLGASQLAPAGGDASAVTVAESFVANLYEADFGQACAGMSKEFRAGLLGFDSTLEDCGFLVAILGPIPAGPKTGSELRPDGLTNVYYKNLFADDTQWAIVVGPETQPDGAVKQRVLRVTLVERS